MTQPPVPTWQAQAPMQAAALWPAPTTLLESTVVEGVSVLLWVQGRQDRVHGLVDAGDTHGLDPRSLGVNWAWCTVGSADAPTPYGWGSLLAEADGWRVLRPAPAIPGIFLRRHAQTYRAWKTLSDF